jgi:hypothetical protein
MSLLSARRLSEYEYQLLGLMLFCLLAASALGSDSDFTRSLLITHFGLFLLWQPILKQEQSFSAVNIIFLIAFILIFIIWFNLWISAFWMLLLLSLLTGRIFARGLGRAAYGLAVVTLFLELILIITPTLFNLTGLSQPLHLWAIIFLLALAILLVLTPPRKLESAHIDFIRGFLIVVLTLFLCMGSVLVTFSTGTPYLQSLASTVMIAALFLFAMAVLWVPRAGFSGLAQLWEKYLLNIGGPFEQWISRLAAIEANTSIQPEQFLNTSIEHLMNRHWICGIHWKSKNEEHLSGTQCNNHVSFNDDKLEITLYTYSPIGPALLLHSKLLLSVLTFYYRAKIQEQQLIKQAHLRAIYETGSKLTHDVKNILQSTQTMTQIILDKDTRIEDTREILKQQLPLLTQRLKTTLEKLATPASDESATGALSNWWNQLKVRYNGRNIEFIEEIDSDPEISVDVFDSIVENLLENARSKRILQPDIDITVQLQCKEKTLRLSVSDTGSAIDESIATAMFNGPLDSEDGFGIGLYQSCQQAKNISMKLELEENTEGLVSFLLATK